MFYFEYIRNLTSWNLAKVKIKDLNITIFYKFVLNIKPRYTCCHLNKQINKKNTSEFHVLELWRLQELRYLIGRLRENSWFLIFIIGFSWSEADHVSSTSFVLEFSSTHLGFILLISIKMCQKVELILITYALRLWKERLFVFVWPGVKKILTREAAKKNFFSYYFCNIVVLFGFYALRLFEMICLYRN